MIETGPIDPSFSPRPQNGEITSEGSNAGFSLWDQKRRAWANATRLAEFPDASDGSFIKSRGQLLTDVLTSGPIKLVKDSAGLLRDGKETLRQWFDLRFDRVYEGVGVPRGDGSPVRVLGGFMSSQIHYFNFTTGLNHAKYKAETLPWGLVNKEPPFEMADYLMPELERVAREAGYRVKLIVHSLGGYDAVAMMLKYPERFVDSIEHVAIIASPIPDRFNTALALGYLVVNMFKDGSEFAMANRLPEIKAIFDSGLVKFTTIESSADPIVGGRHLSYDEDHYIIDGAPHGLLGMHKSSLVVVDHVFAGEEVDFRRYPNIHHPAPRQIAA